jgi:lipopolysaccharide transport system ATP-binding protein
MASVLEIGVGFHPDLSGKENIILNGQLFGHSRKEIMEKLDEIIDFTEFGDFMDMPVKSYSSGMYTRYAFALTSHVDADIFLFDEVFAGGDAAFREKASARIRDLRTKGKSIIWTSHNIGEVLSLCDQMMLLKEGKMMAFGDPLTLVAEYMPSFRAKGSAANSDVYSFMPVQDNRNIKSILREARIVAGEKTDQPESLEMTLSCGTETITAGFIMYTELNAPLTSSFLEVPGKSEPGGTTLLRCRFPQDQLRNGQYKLALFIMKNNFLEEYYTHALVFNIQKDQYISKIDSILPGSVNLKAEWQTINDI